MITCEETMYLESKLDLKLIGSIRTPGLGDGDFDWKRWQEGADLTRLVAFRRGGLGFAERKKREM